MLKGGGNITQRNVVKIKFFDEKYLFTPPSAIHYMKNKVYPYLKPILSKSLKSFGARQWERKHAYAHALHIRAQTRTHREIEFESKILSFCV